MSDEMHPPKRAGLLSEQSVSEVSRALWSGPFANSRARTGEGACSVGIGRGH